MSTSTLQKRTSELISTYLGGFTIRENHRPAWMTNDSGQRLELDFYIEELNTAIEVQGAQHYTYVEAFHGDYSGFIQQLARDDDKRKICYERGIKLFEVSDECEVIDALSEIIGSIPQEDNSLSRWTSFPRINPKSSVKGPSKTQKKNKRTPDYQLNKTMNNLQKELSKNNPNPERINRLQSALNHKPRKYEGKAVDTNSLNGAK